MEATGCEIVTAVERLFVGIKIKPAVASHVAQLIPKHGEPPRKGVSWVKTDNLHLTLKFVGEVSLEQREEIARRLEAVQSAVFSMRLARVDAFRSRGLLRVIHVGVDQGDSAVRLLKQQIDRSLAEITEMSRLDNDFSPHITLARLGRVNIGEIQNWIASNADYGGPEMMVDSFQLFRSTITKGESPQYEVLREYNLFPYNEDCSY